MDTGTDKTEFKIREHGITKRMTVIREGTVLEIKTSRIGYPIHFPIDENFRQFLRSL